ncbi:DUF2797 domain-containing protein [Senegalimassilia anaerobia]|uniref:DUF2797 domain-containing protein n=1 Tax=Senegalimassilia anaerobia TaxID=1473216 RepID=UPI003A954E63
MPNLFADHTVVLAGYGFSVDGPYLTINDLDEGTVGYVPVLGRTFSLRRLPRRRCIGRIDLRTHERSTCPLNAELLPDGKEDMCPACIEATGFNPSFYFSSYISPQQREYNQTPHYVYLAYFAPGYVKAGISSETRGIERLLEQGARAARVVGRFTCADDARALEAALCAQDGVAETMRASLKAKLLADAPYSFEEACHELRTAADRLDDVDAVANAGFSPEDALDLSPYYFGGPSPDAHTMQLPEGEGFADVCGGVCAGMVGANLVFWQDGTNFIAPIKDWESHEIEFLDDEIACEYASEPQQISLF